MGPKAVPGQASTGGFDQRSQVILVDKPDSKLRLTLPRQILVSRVLITARVVLDVIQYRLGGHLQCSMGLRGNSGLTYSTSSQFFQRGSGPFIISSYTRKTMVTVEAIVGLDGTANCIKTTTPRRNASARRPISGQFHGEVETSSQFKRSQSIQFRCREGYFSAN